MTFVDPAFGTLLIACIATYWLLPRSWRLGVVLVASTSYYAFWSLEDLALLLGLLAVVFGLVDRWPARPPDLRTRATAAVLLLLANLAWFKYRYFLADFASGGASIGTSDPTGGLPLGISFYTFQLIAYCVDRARGRVERAEIARGLAFILYFPQLVAGPIVRGQVLLPQLRVLDRLELDLRAFTEGFCRVAKGLFKKLVIADHAAAVVQAYYGDPFGATAPEAVAATFAYSIQIYFDFSAYSDIAIGIGRMMGIELPENFRQPYLSTSVTEFWRRWHITLSQWLRDYLYIPLGGNRRGRARRMVNLLTTMLLGGLWHGAGWNFVLWGGLHGVALAIESLPRPRPLAGRFLPVRRVLLFVLVTWLWIFFRSPDLRTTILTFGHWTRFLGNPMLGHHHTLQVWGAIALLYLSMRPMLLTMTEWTRERLLARPSGPTMWSTLELAQALVFLILSVALAHETSTFIYFQF